MNRHDNTTDLVPTDAALAVAQPMPAPPPASMSFADVERLAGFIVRSRMFGVQTPEQAVALMMLCQADGLHPMQAVRRYHIIQGTATWAA